MEEQLKKEIINDLISGGVLVDEDIISRLDSIKDIKILNQLKENSSLILDNDFLSIIESEEKLNKETSNNNISKDINDSENIFKSNSEYHESTVITSHGNNIEIKNKDSLETEKTFINNNGNESKSSDYKDYTEKNEQVSSNNQENKELKNNSTSDNNNAVSLDSLDNLEDLSDKDEEVYDRKINIVMNYEASPKKRSYKDFVSYFNIRYKNLTKLLRGRQELNNIVAINRLSKKAERESVAAIGMISEVRETTNGHIMFTLEDDTGFMKVLISANSQNKELIKASKSLTVDEVIGITGTMGRNIIFANSIIFPDVPLSKELKKSPVDDYAIFIGDIHFGSKYFLEKEFNKFLKWVNGELGNQAQRDLTKKIKYMFISGDLVEGIGIYPNQENDLTEPDIYKQYEMFSDFIKKIPKRISIVVCPGNHDADRIAEPQPALDKKFYPDIADRENLFMVSSPSIINFGATDSFSGFDLLLYHGYSFPYYTDNIKEIRDEGGMERIDLVMRYLLQRRHLAPSHGSTLYVPETQKDYLTINKVPDFFVTGHIHRATCSMYRNVSLLNTSTWVGMTDYQEKMGLKPQPAKVIICNLQTRAMKMLNFELKKEQDKTDAKEDQ